MARPSEMARNMLNKWVAMREQQGDGKAPNQQRRRNRRPHLASECEHLADAEKFRGQIVREITNHIATIQNPALSEHEVRDLNDTINKLQREKFHWNKRIYQLGGVDYNAIEKKRRIEEGDKQIYSQYRYYGVAKDLPGVQEHLAMIAQKKKRLKRTELSKIVTTDYYGWRDEEDGVLLEVEEAAAASASASRPEHANKKAGRLIATAAGTDNDDDGTEKYEEEEEDYLNVLSQDEISKIVLEEKKKKLLEKYSLL